MKRLQSWASAMALAAASCAASAATWTQTIDPVTNVLVPPNVTLNFDLKTVGYQSEFIPAQASELSTRR